MLVRFTKGAVVAKADTLTCVRDDGSVTTGPMPRQGILPHDAFHFVVESTLGWREAFFGQVARGVALDQIAAKKAGRKTDWAPLTQALQSESLVECLQAEQWGGAAAPGLFFETLAVTCRRRGVAPPVLSEGELTNIRTALRDFGAAWRPLRPTESLERNFPAGGVEPEWRRSR
jgi:hypothetical protein